MKACPVRSNSPVLIRWWGFLLTLAAFLTPICPNIGRPADGSNPLASQPSPAVTPAGGLIIATGSIYLVGAVREAVLHQTDPAQ